ncbi:uncharacterized protein LOC100568635 [Acyrthosiphon pisum]|uniref:Uncharacterized protein n=1 Tax=Acyrthosiphon pisum TaxID=7029 RepID=A0A8R2D2W9_ACYPI|nr:uncharacterized protein LOC100568635 [Acyrthosiphon pisum]|eukprot:XP_016658880.1 PREDICTED: uncharacterized protein LOC100568635 [Acyrthosiphon pisum]
MTDKMKKKDLDNILKDGFSLKRIGGCQIPFILRSVNGKPVKFVATRMAEYELLNNYLRDIQSYIYTTCTPVRAYVITVSEAKILNYINKIYYEKGKDFQYFAGIDYIVRLEDIHNFYLFIHICDKKLKCNNTSGYKEKCGFVRCNSDPNFCIPYCTQNGQKYLPIFYFEGDTESLIQRAVKLENWNLAYLKFCCKLYGVKAEYYAGDSCLVVSIDDIKHLYPPETHFDEFWPAEFANSELTIGKSFLQTNPPGSWFRVFRKVVPDDHTSTAPGPMMEDHMDQLQKQQQQQQQKLTIPQTQAQNNYSNNAPYKIKMVKLDGKTIHCINAKPSIYSDWMVTLKDLVRMVLPSCNVAKCAHVLHTYLKTTILFGNSEQLAVLRDIGLIRSMNPGDTPMAMLKDVTLLLPQLKTFVLMQDKKLNTNTNLQVDNLSSDNISAWNLSGTIQPTIQSHVDL